MSKVSLRQSFLDFLEAFGEELIELDNATKAMENIQPKMTELVDAINETEEDAAKWRQLNLEASTLFLEKTWERRESTN